MNTIKKVLLAFGLLGIFIIVYFLVVIPHLNQESTPYFGFIEVPVNETLNSPVIHFEKKDFVKMGVDLRQENGKLTFIYFRQPCIHPLDFNYMYGSRDVDPASRKYLEYKGVYYYGMLAIP